MSDLPEQLHPDDKVLADFGLGRLSQADHDSVELHVDQCDECCRRLETLPNDGLVTRFRKLSEEFHSLTGLTVTADQKPGTAPKLQISGFEFIKELGRGGMGVVFKARQSNPDRVVAIKMLRDSILASKPEIKRFELESDAIARLQHPGIVSVFEVGESNGRHFFSMEFVEGQPLDVLIQDGPLPIERSLSIAHQIAEAVHYAHQQGIVHRDLKPANIIVQSNGTVKVTDFGLAKYLERSSGLTQSDHIMGTPGYMAPEQADTSKDNVGIHSDVYGLGATLYAMLTGRPPFQASSPIETLRQVVDQTPVSPRLVNPQLSLDIDTICLKCLQKNPDQRFDSALELADEIQRVRDGKPILSRPVSQTEKTILWCRRNPLSASLILASIVILVSGIFVSTFFASIANQRYLSESKLREQAEIREKEAVELKSIAQNAQQKAEAETRKTKDALLKSERNQYVNLVSAIQMEWAANNPSRARTILNSTPGKLSNWSKLRNWEWLYLKNLCHPENLELKAHQEWVMGVDFSPNGNLLASSDKKGVVCLWDITTGTLKTKFSAHQDVAYSIAFSPDGNTFATASADQSVKLWETSSCRCLTTLKNHEGTVEVVKFSRDGTKLAAVGRDQRLVIWDTKTFQIIQTIRQPFAHVYRFSFFPDGNRIALVAGGGPMLGGKVLIYDVRPSSDMDDKKEPGTRPGKPTPPDQVLHGHESFATSVDVSADGKQIVAGSFDGTIILWDSSTGETIDSIKDRPEFITSVAFDPGAERVAFSQADLRGIGGRGAGEVAIWNLREQKVEKRFSSHSDRVRQVRFDSEGIQLASAGYDHRVFVWNSVAEKHMITLDDLDTTIVDVSISPDSSQMVIDGRSLTVRDLKTGQQISEFKGHKDHVRCLSYDPTGCCVASGGSSEPILIWRPEDSTIEQIIEHGQNEIYCVRWSGNGQQLLVTGDLRVAIFDVNTGARIDVIENENESASVAIFCNAGKDVAVGYKSGKIRIINRQDPADIKRLPGHSLRVSALAVHDDRNRLASCSIDGTAKTWHLGTQKELMEFRGHTRNLNDIHFNPDGSRIITGGRDTFVKLWDTETGDDVLTLRGHREGVLGLDISSDAKRIVSVGYGGRVVIWNGSE